MTLEEVIADFQRLGGNVNNKIFEPLRNRCLNNAAPYFEVMLSALTGLPTYLLKDTGKVATLTNLYTGETHDYEYNDNEEATKMDKPISS